MPAPLAFILFILVCQIVYALYSGLPLPQAKERQFYAHEDEDDQTETETLEVDHEVVEPILLIEPALEELPTNPCIGSSNALFGQSGGQAAVAQGHGLGAA